MKIAIMQPTYLPWVGYFDLIDQVDSFVFLDDVQLTKRSWQVRNRIKTPQGELMLSVPVLKAPRGTLLSEAQVKDELDWRTKHLRNIRQHYLKAPQFRPIFAQLEALIGKPCEGLADSNIRIIEGLCALLGLPAEFRRSSALRSQAASRGEGLLELCQSLGASAYLSPLGSAGYLEGEGSARAFERAGIELRYQNYQPAPYRQLHGDFVPYLSVVDLLLNEGAERALELLRAGAKEPLHSDELPS